MVKYQYKKLDQSAGQVRLLTFYPGDFGSDIVVSLSIVNLTRIPTPLPRISLKEIQETVPADWTPRQTTERRIIYFHRPTEATSWTHPDPSFKNDEITDESLPPVYQPCFEALSYTWGSLEDSGQINVDQGPGTQHATISVTRNLATALQYLRLADATRTLWIDALSINQEDDVERNHQVKLMAQIYSLAHRVIVWLGTEADGSKHAIGKLAYLGEQLVITTDNFRYRSPEATEPDWYHSWFELPYAESTWRAIYDLISRSWFERLWVTQEIQLAHPSRALVVCGRDTIPWSYFRRAIYCLWAKKQVPWDYMRLRLTFIQSIANDQLGEPFTHLLRLSQGRHCSDPRDKVYGLLGMASPILADRIEPQYSATVSSVYRDAFLSVSTYNKRLDLLQFCDIENPHTDTNTPSWIPNWASPRVTRMLGDWQYSSGASSAHFQHIRDRKSLTVTGVLCGTIQEVADSAPTTHEEALHALRAHEPEEIHASSAKSTSEDLLAAYVRTIVGNRLKDRFPVDSVVTFEELKKTFRSKLSKSTGPLDTDVLNIRNIYLAAQFVIGRKFFITDKGDIGLGPRGAQKGDEVVSILGCNAPLLVRPNTMGEHKVVGEAFVSALADATAFLGPLASPWRVQISWDSLGMGIYRYHNSATNESILEDPRLGPVPEEWKRLEGAERTPDLPEIFEVWRNNTTGEDRNSDPRLDVGSLKARGVYLRDFQLV